MPNPINQVPPDILINKVGYTTPIWLNWFNSLFRTINNSAQVTTGIIAPTSTPNKIGDFYIDTLARKLYFAVGTTNAGDWEIAN